MCRERRPAKGWGRLAEKWRIEVEVREEGEVEEKEENRPSEGGRSQIGCDAS